MFAIDIAAPGGPEVLSIQEFPRPLAQRGEVLIKVEAAGVNRPDILQRMGIYNPPATASPILGLEVAGTIIKVGPRVKNCKVGDPVVALTNGGGYAQYVAVPAGQVLPLPKNYSMAEGAALPETLFTVRQTLIERAKLKPGQTVLIHGGASGIGATAIQMAKLMGASPITTVSSDVKAAYAKQMGALETIDYIKENFVERVNSFTNNKGVDVILDIVGGDYLGKHLTCVAKGGTIIQLAMLGGAKAEINLAKLLMKQVTLFGSTLRAQPNRVKTHIAKNLLKHVWPKLEAGGFQKPRIKTFELQEAPDAHRHMMSQVHFGKIVLTVS